MGATATKGMTINTRGSVGKSCGVLNSMGTRICADDLVMPSSAWMQTAAPPPHHILASTKVGLGDLCVGTDA